jgi:ATP-dependent DNA helicase RecQ
MVSDKRGAIINIQQKFFNIDGKEFSEIEDYKWSRLIKVKDGWKCANTDKYPDRDHTLFHLNAHHIFPKKFGGKNTISNGITYCRACHLAKHPEHQKYFLNDNTFNKISIKLLEFIKKFFHLKSNLPYKVLLKYLTGNEHFRSIQKKIIKQIVEEKKNVFIVMPTGMGKSLLYQIPGLINNNLPTMILSPLRALQNDQTVGLSERWVPATYINSDLDKGELSSRIKAIFENLYRFIFIHPKQLLVEDKNKDDVRIKNYKPISKIKINYLVVDEVHVIRDWGKSFISEYNYLNKIWNLYNKPQLILLTASASKKTRKEIIDNLRLTSNEISEYATGFYRQEINIRVDRVNYYLGNDYIDKDEYLASLLTDKVDGKTLVFTSSIKNVDKIFDTLGKNKNNVCIYHSKLSSKKRNENYQKFLNSYKNNVMICTSAFGMGVDIPNIRRVIHYDPPFSISDYYQQIGRVGRDGKKSEAILLHDRNDFLSLIKYINDKQLDEIKNDTLRNKLKERFEYEYLIVKFHDIVNGRYQKLKLN